MRHLKSNELNSIRIEEDMLKGNINRMCVCEDEDELVSQYEYAKKRLDRIFSVNEKRFEDENKVEKESQKQETKKRRHSLLVSKRGKRKV